MAVDLLAWAGWLAVDLLAWTGWLAVDLLAAAGSWASVVVAAVGVVAVELKLQTAAAATKVVALPGSSSEVEPVVVEGQHCKSKADLSKADLQMVVGTAVLDLGRDYIGAGLLKLGFV